MGEPPEDSQPGEGDEPDEDDDKSDVLDLDAKLKDRPRGTTLRELEEMLHSDDPAERERGQRIYDEALRPTMEKIHAQFAEPYKNLTAQLTSQAAKWSGLTAGIKVPQFKSNLVSPGVMNALKALTERQDMINNFWAAAMPQPIFDLPRVEPIGPPRVTPAPVKEPQPQASTTDEQTVLLVFGDLIREQTESLVDAFGELVSAQAEAEERHATENRRAFVVSVVTTAAAIVAAVVAVVSLVVALT